MGRIAVLAAALGMALAACGDDDEDAGGSAASTTEAAAEETTTTAAEGELAEVCALAREISEQEDFPSPEQVQRYQELAPEELQPALDVAVPSVVDNADDPVAMMAAFADDDVEAAIAEIDAFEDENCGTNNENPGPQPEEPEEGAAVVEVTAVDYSFEVPEQIAAGRTSFVLTNTGAEAHFMLLSRIVQGTMEEALAYEGDPEEAGLVEDVEGGESGLAAPGGQDVETVTVDLEPGNYAMLCFVPGPDGTPHAFNGMAVPLTVA